MKPLVRLTSKTLVLAQENIDTDQIIPARFLTTTTSKGLGQHCFADWRYETDGTATDSVLNDAIAKHCEILVAGKNFGCGSSREHAPWALLDFGFRVVISSEIADIFSNNASNNGLLPITLNAAEHQWLLAHPGEEVTVDLERCYVEFAGGHRAKFKVQPFARQCMLKGLDSLGFLLDQDKAIERFEKGQAA